MVKPINLLSNEEHAKVLRATAEPVIGMPDEVKELIADLADTCMNYPHCIGLSSNQIWDKTTPPPAVFVIRTQTGIWPVINPEVDKQWKKEIKDSEGCMSQPGLSKKVVRPRHIAVSYYDLEGALHTDVHLFDMAARVFLHEYDHLKGIMLEDK